MPEQSSSSHYYSPGDGPGYSDSSQGIDQTSDGGGTIVQPVSHHDNNSLYDGPDDDAFDDLDDDPFQSSHQASNGGSTGVEPSLNGGKDELYNKALNAVRIFFIF
jgi:hypothetical protein